MKTTTKNSIIKGTFILTIAGIFSRLLGFYNRIFLTGLFGARELGIYQMIFPIYMVIFSLCCQGIQTALTRQIARPDFNNKPAHATLLRFATIVSATLSTVCSILVFFGAPWISETILHSTECTSCLRILSFAFPFVSVKGCLIGYYIGIQKSGTTAWSQLVEQIAKILSVYFITTYIFRITPKAYLAVYGIVIGEVASCLWMIFSYLHTKRKNCISSQELISSKMLRNELIKDAIPLTTNRLSLTALQSLEAILIPHMLNLYLHQGDAALILYGTLTGMVLPCIMFPTTLTSSLATMLLPAISSEYNSEHMNSIRSIVRKSISFCLLIGVASTTFLLLFGKWGGTLLFGTPTAGELLFQFALLCPFIYLSTCLASIMNAIGKAPMNLLFSIIGIGIRIGFILCLVPKVGLPGYMWGMMTSYLLQTTLLVLQIRRCFRYEALETASYGAPTQQPQVK